MNSYEVEKSKMATIAICAFMKNDISRKVIELENFVVKPYVSDIKESFGPIYFILHGVTLLCILK